MHNNKIVTALFVIIFLIASFLRIFLAVVNRDANDNHFKVIRIIANEKRIPGKEEFECLQCYHPKLYHYTAAKMINLFSVSSTDMTDEQKIISQMLNAIAGIITLFVIYRFLKKFDLSNSSVLITFSLIALNPALIGISAQATNDMFVILFSTLALFFLHSFLKSSRWKDLILLMLFVILASLSKGSGLLIFFGILIVFFLKIISAYGNSALFKRYAFSALIFLVICFPSIAFIGPYAQYYKAYGTPFVLNKPVSSFPQFFTKTYEGDKTGVTSIADSYLTFRLFDLLKNPYLNRETEPIKYSANRTSVWTQLYARTVFIQFEGTPKKWIVKPTNPVFKMGKIIFVVALVPLIFFLYGVFLANKRFLADFWRQKFSYLSGESDWIFLLFFWMFIAFIIKFTLDYRDFVSMKPIYLFPAILAFAYIFSLGFDNAYERIKKSTLLKYGLHGSIIFLLLLYILDIAHLLEKLS